MSEEQIIVIADWQRWLSQGPRMGEAWVAPELKRVSYRHYRYGNAENVFIFTPTLASALTAYGCRFSVKGLYDRA